MPRWQARARKASRTCALYAALIVMPLAGYLGSVLSGYPVKWFGITLPAWGRSIRALKDVMSTVHLVDELGAAVARRAARRGAPSCTRCAATASWRG